MKILFIVIISIILLISYIIASIHIKDNIWLKGYVFEDWLDDHLNNPLYAIFNLFNHLLWPITIFIDCIVYNSYDQTKISKGKL